MDSSGFIKQHRVLSFYVATFGISWGAILVAVGLGGVPRNPMQLAKMIPVMVAAMLAGPAVASISVTGIAGGRKGYRELLSHLIRWRVPIGLYVAALLTAPLVLMTVPLALSLRFPNFVPRILTESNKDSFSTAAIVGVLWGAWHVPVNIVSCVTPSGALSVPSLLGTLLFSFVLLPAYRVLMVKVWDHTGSLLVAILMHFSLTASNIILGPAATPGTMAITFNLILAAAMWIVAAGIVVASRRHPPVHVLHG